MGSSGSSTTVVQPTPPPKTAQEREFERIQLQVARETLDAIRQQNEFTAEQFELIRPGLEAAAREQNILSEIFTPEEQEQIFRDQLERQLRLGPIQDELLDLELERIRRGGAASPQQLELISGATDAAILAGERDISRFRDESIEAVAEQIAPALGLRPTDSPVVDRAQRIANRGQDLQQDLVTSLRGAEAQARLNFPLAVDQFQSGLSNFQLERARAVDEFRQQLQQASINSRLGFGQGVGQLGLGISQPGFGFINQGVAGQNALRLGLTGSVTRNSFTEPGSVQFANIAGGIGSLFSGVGSILPRPG